MTNRPRTVLTQGRQRNPTERPVETNPYFDIDGFYVSNPGDIINGYKILGVLGQGTFGRVLLAEKDGLQFAIKAGRTGAQFERQIQKEVVLNQKINNLQICPRIELTFKHQNCYFVVQELCEQALGQYLGRYKFGLPYKELLVVAKQLAILLKSFHEQDLVHADVKPNNVMFLKSNQPETMRLIDLGCAGTPEQLSNYVQSRWYRAPDVMFARKPYTSKIDMWSMGCVLFEARMRRYMFQAQTQLQLCKQMVQYLGVPPQAPSQFFVKNTFQYWFKNKAKLEELGLDQNTRVYPNEEMLQGPCEKRELRTECQNLSLNEGYEIDAKIAVLIGGLIQWDPSSRWSADQVIQFVDECLGL